MADYDWHARNNEYPINDRSLSFPYTDVYEQPIPTWLWRTNVFYNDGYPFTDLMITVPLSKGAFLGCLNLSKIKIARSVNTIGPISFSDTALTSVNISSNCSYSPTSFPPGCEIHFIE